MTTNNRMFGNLLITKFVKVMSILLVACMLVITLTACGTVSQKDVEETTEYSTEGGHDDRDVDDPDEPIDDGQWHDEDPTGEPSEEPSTTEEPSTQPQGAYSYNVYGYTISMDINVDDYITGDWFLLAEMAYDLGWVGNDIYTAVDTSDPTTYSSQWFAHHDGDIMTRIDLGYYNEEQVPGTSGYQFRTVNVRFLTNSNSNYYTVSKTVKITINKEKTKITAKAKKFKKSLKTKKYTVTLKNSKGKVVKKVSVSLKVKGKTYYAKTNSKGKATFKITKLTKKGKFNASVTYKGNKYYAKATKKVRITII